LLKVNILVYLLLLLWHAPLGVRSAKRRHQSPEWTILSHVNCFIQGEVIGFQVLLDSLHPRSTSASWWSPPIFNVWCPYIFSYICVGI